MNDFNTTSQPKKKQKTQGRRGDGFFEALGDIGRSVKKSVKSDVLEGTARSIHDQLVGAQTDRKVPDENQSVPEFDFAEWIKAKEEEISKDAKQEGKEEERAAQKVRRKEKVVFSFADERVRKEINEIRQELQALVEAMGDVEEQVEKAVVQEVVNPGVYHLNFFEQIKSWIQFMRKSLQDGELWMEMWKTRSNKGAYWKGVKKGGTKFMLSQERYMATQAG